MAGRSVPSTRTLGEHEIARLFDFERCPDTELATFSLPALAQYRALMVRYAATAAGSAEARPACVLAGRPGGTGELARRPGRGAAQPRSE